MRFILTVLTLIFFTSCFNTGTEEAKTSVKEELKTRTEVKKPTVTTRSTQVKRPAKPAVQARPQQQKQGAAIAGNVDQGDYEAKNKGWLVNFDEAYQLSEKSGKPILANFTGSDWCGWCKRLDKSVFHKPGFEKWAKDNVVLLELDFPKRFRLPTTVASQNNGLKNAFGVRGFPTIWLFDAEKDEAGRFNFSKLGKTGYTKTVQEFTGKLDGYLSARKQS